MPRYENKTAEYLWHIIDAMKRTPETKSGNGATTPTPDPELSELIPLAESLSTIFEDENQASSGQTSARLRLQAAIQADLISGPVPARPGHTTWSRFGGSSRVAFMALIILLAVVAMAVAFWNAPTSVPTSDSTNVVLLPLKQCPKSSSSNTKKPGLAPVPQKATLAPTLLPDPCEKNATPVKK